MWILYALGAAFFSGLTSVLCKAGVDDVDSEVSTTIRTLVILFISFIVTFYNESVGSIENLNIKQIIFLILSGISTSLLWICYFKALQLGNVSKVTPIDKTSIVLTLILSMIFLGEKITFIKVISMILILFGTFLTINKVQKDEKSNSWILYAVLTAIFTSITTIISKIGLKNIDSSLATFIRTIVVLGIMIFVLLFKKKFIYFKYLNKNNLKYIVLSGVSTSLSWLCYFKALQDNEASVVFTIEKMSLVVAITLSYFFLKEKISTKSLIGIIIITIGTGILLF